MRRGAKGKFQGKKFIKGDQKFQKRHPAPPDGSIEIYVGNLSYDLTEDRLRKEFEAYGVVNSARIITNRYTNKSKGFGFVHMPNRAEADAAVKALSDKDILGRKLKCNEAKNLV
ncbi:MAG: RNA-binding protein [Kiritimatiellae bacterium]|nr:RNA-binding protein [Kiritimatiellia bacterium]MBR5457903.1 RNA-binding protein [Kiritimatiellia bacterium]